MSQPPIPGLGMVEAPAAAESQLETAARRTLTALWNSGALDDTHALACQLVIELARAVDAGTRAGKASAVAMAAAQLRETWQALLPVDGAGAGEGEALAALVRDLRASSGLPSLTVIRSEVSE